MTNQLDTMSILDGLEYKFYTGESEKNELSH
jgi:hypothetical protein